MITVAIFLAIFAWWFFTGLILLAVRWADRRGGEFHKMLVISSLPILALGIAATAQSLDQKTVSSVYLGFFGALAVWGWIELAFLTGIVSGPVRSDCPPDVRGKERFFRAFGTVSHHELLLTLGLFGLVIASSEATNRMALATYLILFLARILAKLNLFFGVPRINTEFLPQPLSHLKSYFRTGPVTPAFAAAVTILTALLVVCAERLMGATSLYTQTGYALLTALAALALLEHWLMVVPLPDAKLWRWMLPAPTLTQDQESKTNGF